MAEDNDPKQLTDNDPKELTRIGRINRRTADDYVGETKPWWKTSRRTFIVGGAIGAGALLTGIGLWGVTGDDTTDVDKDSLELQRTGGWNVGSEDRRLSMPSAQVADSQQSDAWKRYLDSSAMLSAYQPQTEAWMPFFVPTLIQSLQSETLRGQLAPLFTPGMKESYERGQALAREFLDFAENAGEVAFVIDLAGPESIALGAGMADSARLITTFDNFPHPLGVTPSHETLGAMLYYAAEIEAKQQKLSPSAPPVFLLDSKRLAAYGDADTQFDNRYLTKLPSAERFQERNIKSIIYVTPDRTRTEELDDLNEDFVEYKNKGLNVAMLPLSDFTPTDGTGGQTQTGATEERRYYYGGSPGSHLLFFYAYPFFRPYPAYASRYPGYAGASSMPRSVAPPRYIPAPRPTMFSGTRIGSGSAVGVGRSKPSGFGRATVRVAPSGSVVGTRAGRSGFYSPSRSGSFGRGGGYSG